MVSFPKKQPQKPMSQVEINRLIEKGAPVKQDSSEEEKKWTCVNLRFPTALLNEVDEIVNGMLCMSRTGWIFQTIQKELKRLNSKESPKGSKDKDDE